MPPVSSTKKTCWSPTKQGTVSPQADLREGVVYRYLSLKKIPTSYFSDQVADPTLFKNPLIAWSTAEIVRILYS